MMVLQQFATFFNKPVKPVAAVHDQAHSGSPYVLPAQYQTRVINRMGGRQQPHERGKTWTVATRTT